ncbi:hypothetical protein TRFO_32450 [Tritrichomonas foetus]|uniref:Uncharacterized protein n=1 Tax=Tritrichomonas foetus TaxID=1144522 RepID=A0A1J4JTD9_9EUKA|nr:hypothetical protein TRFO_32450 [Tritrichomonas foetus]|eukprot:OHT00764.1 hypothetical protein TRFO_32450 [Tritrichomonas foetus]
MLKIIQNFRLVKPKKVSLLNRNIINNKVNCQNELSQIVGEFFRMHNLFDSLNVRFPSIWCHHFIFDYSMSTEITTISNLLNRIRTNVENNPKNLEPVITELNSILNKYDPEYQDKNRSLPLVPSNFDPDAVYEKICRTSEKQSLKIPFIRFKADEFSKSFRIPLPNYTRKHREPLLQWYNINWDILEPSIRLWRDEVIPDTE